MPTRNAAASLAIRLDDHAEFEFADADRGEDWRVDFTVRVDAEYVRLRHSAGAALAVIAYLEARDWTGVQVDDPHLEPIGSEWEIRVEGFGWPPESWFERDTEEY